MKDSPNLDFLRAFAVLSVLVGHLAWRTGARSGVLVDLAHLGVVFFFVHTALVLMFSLERLQTEDKAHVALRFYIRRAFRIYPLAIGAVLTVFAFEASHGMLGKAFWSHPARALLSNLLLVQNITKARSLPEPLWSLPFEVQVYLLLPFIFVLLRRYRPLLAISLLYAAGLGLSLFLPLAKYFPCFLAGVFSYVLWKTVPKRIVSFWWVALISVVSAMYCLAGFSDRGDWAAALALGLAVPFFQQISWPWLATGAKLVAQYSYGIYLSHSPLAGLVFGRHWPSPVKWLAFLVLAAAIPVLAYHLLEAPLIRVGARLAGRVRPKTAEPAAAMHA